MVNTTYCFTAQWQLGLASYRLTASAASYSVPSTRYLSGWYEWATWNFLMCSWPRIFGHQWWERGLIASANITDRYAVAVVKDDGTTVGHLPKRISRICSSSEAEAELFCAQSGISEVLDGITIMRILLKKNGHQMRRVVTVPKRVTTVKRLRVRKKVETTISVKHKSYRKYFNENKLWVVAYDQTFLGSKLLQSWQSQPSGGWYLLYYPPFPP